MFKNVHLILVPLDYDFNDRFNTDQKRMDETVQNVREFIKSFADIPLFSLCLADQILALAAVKTYRMRFDNKE